MTEKQGACLFCKGVARDRDKVGQTFHKDGVTVHQYCLYFASGLSQRGEEKEGIHGFLLADIRKEFRRACKLKCSFCHSKGAATGCSVQSCRQMCHTSCALSNGFQLLHHGRFEAFCRDHSTTQPPSLAAAALSKGKACCICLNRLESDQNPLPILVCPICETGFHRTCLQTQAWTAGSFFFRCSVCASKEEFADEMLRMGLEIPEKDAEWEQDGQFSQQYEEPKECQARNCFCPDGKTFYTRLSKYSMKKCTACGQVLGHFVCVKGDICADCELTTLPSNRQSSDSCGASANNRGCTEVGVVNSEMDVARESSVSSAQCDCIICQAKKTHSPSPSVLPAQPLVPLPTASGIVAQEFTARPSTSPISSPPAPVGLSVRPSTSPITSPPAPVGLSVRPSTSPLMIATPSPSGVPTRPSTSPLPSPQPLPCISTRYLATPTITHRPTAQQPFNPSPTTTSTGFPSANTLQSPRLSLDLGLVSPTPSMFVNPPTPSSSLITSSSFFISLPSPDDTSAVVQRSSVSRMDTSSPLYFFTPQASLKHDDSLSTSPPVEILSFPKREPPSELLLKSLTPHRYFTPEVASSSPPSITPLTPPFSQNRLSSSPLSFISYKTPQLLNSSSPSTGSSSVISYFNYVNCDDLSETIPKAARRRRTGTSRKTSSGRNRRRSGMTVSVARDQVSMPRRKSQTLLKKPRGIDNLEGKDFLVSVPIDVLAPLSVKWLKARRDTNDHVTSRFLRSRGMKPKTLRIVLFRVSTH